MPRKQKTQTKKPKQHKPSNREPRHPVLKKPWNQETYTKPGNLETPSNQETRNQAHKRTIVRSKMNKLPRSKMIGTTSWATPANGQWTIFDVATSLSSNLGSILTMSGTGLLMSFSGSLFPHSGSYPTCNMQTQPALKLHPGWDSPPTSVCLRMILVPKCLK